MFYKKQAMIFDMDGTLIDSMWIWKRIDEEFLGRFNMVLPDNLEKYIEGMSFTETAAYFQERFQLPIAVDEIQEIWNQMAWDKYQREVPLKKGALSFLSYLKLNRYKLGIATSNSRVLVDLVLKTHNINHIFDCVVTSCEVGKGKPAPDIYLEVAKRLDVTPECCLAFEDVPAGIKAGKSAGMQVCAIEDDFSKHMYEEKRLLADYYINDYDEVIGRIQ